MVELATIERVNDTEVVGNITSHIDDLEVVIKGVSKPLTISINGEWGAGKTTFLNEWEKQKQGNSIFIDAFATDFINNPLAVILSKFSECKYFKEEELFKKLTKEKLDFEKITKNSFAELVKLLTVSLVDLKDATKENSINGTIDDFRKFNQAIKTFKDTISALQKTKEKLYIFVDELDRCRPTYAVEFIEIVKHFFEIDNTVFIFAINKKELCSSIKHVQGCENPDRYLKKFFNFNYDLPVLSSKDFIQYLVSKNEFGIEKRCCDQEFKAYLEFFANLFHLHPRDIEQCYSTLMIVLKKIGKNEPCLFIYPLIFFTIIREKDTESKKHYESLVNYARTVEFNSRLGNVHVDKDNYETIYSKLRNTTLVQELISWTGLITEVSIDRAVFETWVLLYLCPFKITKWRNFRSVLGKIEEQHQSHIRQAQQNNTKKVYSRLDTIQMENFFQGIEQLFYELPEEVDNYETLAQYIDSLLNFSNKFNKG